MGTRYLGINRFLEEMIFKLKPDNEHRTAKGWGKEEYFRE